MKSNIGLMFTTWNKLNHERIVAGNPTKSISEEYACIDTKILIKWL